MVVVMPESMTATPTPLPRDAVLTARERRADRLPGALHRGERRAIDHHALDARVGGDRGQRDVVDLADLRAAIERTARDAASEDAHVRVASELHDDARASRQLTGAVTENGIQLVAAIVGLRRDRRGRQTRRVQPRDMPRRTNGETV